MLKIGNTSHIRPLTSKKFHEKILHLDETSLSGKVVIQACEHHVTAWCRNGKLHRENGPAMIWSDGTEEWYQNDELHREDGPAFTKPDGTEIWWWEGENVHVKNQHQFEQWKKERGLERPERMKKGEPFELHEVPIRSNQIAFIVIGEREWADAPEGRRENMKLLSMLPGRYPIKIHQGDEGLVSRIIIGADEGQLANDYLKIEEGQKVLVGDPWFWFVSGSSAEFHHPDYQKCYDITICSLPPFGIEEQQTGNPMFVSQSKNSDSDTCDLEILESSGRVYNAEVIIS